MLGFTHTYAVRCMWPMDCRLEDTSVIPNLDHMLQFLGKSQNYLLMSNVSACSSSIPMDGTKILLMFQYVG